MDRTAALAILKERYSFNKVVQLGWRKTPLFAMLKKDFGGGGEHEKIPVNIAGNQAASATFATAQTLAASTNSKFAAFKADWQDSFGIARVDGKTIRRTRNKEGGWLMALAHEIEAALQTVKMDTERALFRDGTGIIGVGDGAYTAASTSLVLADASQAHCFQLGMEIGATADTASTPRTGTATVTGINRATGTLTSDSNWSAQITSLDNADSLFRAGDYTAADDVKKIHGLESWCPATAPTAGDSHFGVDRSVDVERLAGSRYDGSGVNIDEALINGQSVGSANGALPRVCIINNIDMRDLVNTLGAKKIFPGRGFLPVQGPDGPIGDLGFETIQIQGDTGKIDVLGHPLCPVSVARMFDPDLLVLSAMGEFPGIIDDDDQQSLRVSDANGVEARVGGYPELFTQHPDSIVRIVLP